MLLTLYFTALHKKGGAYCIRRELEETVKSVCPIPHRMRLPPAQAQPHIMWQQSLFLFSSKNSIIKTFGTETNTKLLNIFLFNKPTIVRALIGERCDN